MKSMPLVTYSLRVLLVLLAGQGSLYGSQLPPESKKWSLKEIFRERYAGFGQGGTGWGFKDYTKKPTASEAAQKEIDDNFGAPAKPKKSCCGFEDIFKRVKRLYYGKSYFAIEHFFDELKHPTEDSLEYFKEALFYDEELKYLADKASGLPSLGIIIASYPQASDKEKEQYRRIFRYFLPKHMGDLSLYRFESPQPLTIEDEDVRDLKELYERYNMISLISWDEVIEHLRAQSDTRERLQDVAAEMVFQERLVELFADIIDHRNLAHFEAFDKLYIDRARARREWPNVDNLMICLPGRLGMGDYLSDALRQNADKRGALLIAARVQAGRTKKNATIRALFKAFEQDYHQVKYLMEWFKWFPEDVDAVKYKAGTKIGDKLNQLVLSADAAMQKAAICLARVVRPYRAAEMKAFNDLLEAYKEDKAKLPELKAWFEKNPFDIDSTPVNLAEPGGEKLGDRINALKDYALSSIFKDTRSKVPASAAQQESGLRPVVWFIGAAVVYGVVHYLTGMNAQKKQEQADYGRLFAGGVK